MTGTIRTTSFRLDDPREPARVIRGRVERPPEGASASARLPCVIVLHGFKGFMDWGFFPSLSLHIAQRGMVAVSFNMSGSGIGDDLHDFTEPEAFARNTISRELEDLERVRRWIETNAELGIDAGRISLLGHSRGGGIALLHAAERGDCRAVVTWAAVPSFDRYDEDTRRMWREQGFILIHNARTGTDHRVDLTALDDVERNAERLDIRRACSRLATPTLLVHGTADQTVPIAALEELSACIPTRWCTTLRVAGANHTFGITHPMPRRLAPDVQSAWEQVLNASLAMLERHARDDDRRRVHPGF